MFSKHGFFKALVLVILIMLGLFAFVTFNLAAEFPTKSIELVVPTGAGGGTDLLGRVVAREAERSLGVSIIIVNKAGGTCTIGTTYVSKAKPDGYTLLWAPSGPILTQPHLLDNLQYSLSDFKAIMGVVRVPVVIAVREESRWKTIEDILQEEDTITTGHPGPGSFMHLTQEEFFDQAGIEIKQVPFQGGAKTVTALLGGHVDLITSLPSEVMPYVEAGQLRVLAITAPDRIEALPDVPTLKEKGYNIVMELRWFLLAPKDTPKDIVEVLEKSFIKAAKSEKVKEYTKNNKQVLSIMGSEEITRTLENESIYFGKLIDELGL